MGMLFLVLVGLIAWLVVRPRDRNWPPTGPAVRRADEPPHLCLHGPATMRDWLGLPDWGNCFGPVGYR